ncbi:5-formyltetrahydrofolate cyclo-ligase [Glaciecola sp. MF2-115]|uniref:5-formyltetrahydrofolate cyclo-ligase n=1 Tax=Glaciecola sp. MF2-115 TaxID=3384827 RepID=UPI0039A1B541
MSGSATRHELRKAFRDKRLSLSPEQQNQAGLQLVEQYQQHAIFKGTRNIAIYLSFNGELNTRALIDYLWSAGCKVFVPILHPFCAGHLLFQEFTAHSQMRLNSFGIAEPKLDVRYLCPIQDLDVIFTPLVAFDIKGNRLGMGGGFYDRTLASLQSSSNETSPILTGLAHDIQLSPHLPTEAWDIPLPYILTPNKLYSFT